MTARFATLVLALCWSRVATFVPQSVVPRQKYGFGFVGKHRGPSLHAINVTDAPHLRFERTADSVAQVTEPCILTIENRRYNLTAWAKAHPGGSKVLLHFHGKNATQAFAKAHHSAAAYAMLEDFAIDVDETPAVARPTQARWRTKLFTNEDPRGLHKTLGVFCLLHFLLRYTQMYFRDPAASLSTSRLATLCLIPHALLSVSSLIFPTVPRDRVVGKPMIWKEFRLHNIIFGVRSVVTAGLAALSCQSGHTAGMRRLAVRGSCTAVLAANIAADVVSKHLQPSQLESTTATMPYWEGCSVATQKRFKSFYAYSQFMATLACLAVGNPAWPFAVLLAIQLASLLMTLVRKGLLSARGYHYAYTASLIMPYFVGLRSILCGGGLDFAFMVPLGYLLYRARRRGVNKYALWLPVIVARLAIGDQVLHWDVW